MSYSAVVSTFREPRSGAPADAWVAAATVAMVQLAVVAAPPDRPASTGLDHPVPARSDPGGYPAARVGAPARFPAKVPLERSYCSAARNQAR
jgi:hypothetical protein